MRVLIVDDEERYRVYLKENLISEGHEVVVAANGREAIDRGLQFHPDVLVTDWMLNNHYHGLQVAAALGAAKPDTLTIMITGFASRDLRSQAASGRLIFMEKPFAPRELATTIASAPPVPRFLRTRVAFGVIIAAANGAIRLISPRARQMLSATSAESARTLDQVFGADAQTRIDSWYDDFQMVTPTGPRRVRWWVGARRIQNGTILVLLPERKRSLRTDERVLHLLDRSLPEATNAHRKIRAIVVDNALIGEAPYVNRLERLGCVCYKAETAELAIKLLQAESGIDVVVIDEETVGPGVPDLVARLRDLRPEIRLVGVGGKPDCETDFQSAGVNHLLKKPWTVTSLFQILDE